MIDDDNSLEPERLPAPVAATLDVNWEEMEKEAHLLVAWFNTLLLYEGTLLGHTDIAPHVADEVSPMLLACFEESARRVAMAVEASRGARNVENAFRTEFKCVRASHERLLQEAQGVVRKYTPGFGDSPFISLVLQNWPNILVDFSANVCCAYIGVAFDYWGVNDLRAEPLPAATVREGFGHMTRNVSAVLRDQIHEAARMPLSREQRAWARDCNARFIRLVREGVAPEVAIVSLRPTPRAPLVNEIGE